MKARRILGFVLLAALPWAIGCTSSRNSTPSSSTQSSGLGLGLCSGQGGGFFGKLCGRKDNTPPKPAQGCVPQWQSNDQAMHQGMAPAYQGTAMYMEGPSISMGSSCNPCTTGTILPGSSLPCTPGAPGVIGQPGTNPAPSRTQPLAQPIQASPTKLGSLNP